MNISMLAPTPAFIPPMPVLTDNTPPLSERKSVGLALRRARKTAGIETAQAAELGGISVAQLGNIERGNHPLTSIAAGNLSRLPAAFGLSWSQFVAIAKPVYGSYVAFLSTPDGDLNKVAAPIGSEQLTESVVKLPFTMKNVYSIIQAGNSDMQPDPEVSPIPVPNDILEADTEIFRVQGDSIQFRAGTISEGDLIFVNTRRTEISSGAIFLIRTAELAPSMRRAQQVGDAMWLFGDSPCSTPIEAQHAQIIGTIYKTLSVSDV